MPVRGNVFLAKRCAGSDLLEPRFWTVRATSLLWTANLAIRPTHLFEVIQAGILSCAFLGHVYELYEPLAYWVVLLFSVSRRFISATISSSTTNRSCRSLAVLAFRNSPAWR